MTPVSCPARNRCRSWPACKTISECGRQMRSQRFRTWKGRGSPAAASHSEVHAIDPRRIAGRAAGMQQLVQHGGIAFRLQLDPAVAAGCAPSRPVPAAGRPLCVLARKPTPCTRPATTARRRRGARRRHGGRGAVTAAAAGPDRPAPRPPAVATTSEVEARAAHRPAPRRADQRAAPHPGRTQQPAAIGRDVARPGRPRCPRLHRQGHRRVLGPDREDAGVLVFAACGRHVDRGLLGRQPDGRPAGQRQAAAGANATGAATLGSTTVRAASGRWSRRARPCASRAAPSGWSAAVPRTGCARSSRTGPTRSGRRAQRRDVDQHRGQHIRLQSQLGHGGLGRRSRRGQRPQLIHVEHQDPVLARHRQGQQPAVGRGGSADDLPLPAWPSGRAAPAGSTPRAGDRQRPDGVPHRPQRRRGVQQHHILTAQHDQPVGHAGREQGRAPGPTSSWATRPGAPAAGNSKTCRVP